MKYEEFVKEKLGIVHSAGINASLRDYGLFPHQKDLVSWALRRGRAAIFADTGLGKSRMQLAWADMVAKETGKRVLILAPLAVAEQTVEEGVEIGVKVTHAREQEGATGDIVITNYDRLHKFDVSQFGAVVLDESSIIKHHAAKTLQILLDAFKYHEFKLCATATPAPNDWTELGNHAEFLGVRSRVEMLAEFFVHDGGDTQTWRLKGHARKLFWKWVASWGAMVRSPSDLGHDASAYELPPLTVHSHTVEIEHNPAHGLFAMEAQTLMERRDARRQSMVERVASCILQIKNENAKLAENRKGVFSHGMEKGICGGSQNESESRSGVQVEAQRTVCKRQGSAKEIHEGVLRKQSGEIQETITGETSGIQRKAKKEVCGGRGDSCNSSSEGEGMARCQSGKEESTETSEVRYSAIGLQGHASDAERIVCDLRILGHERPELLPCGGSLPLDGNCKGASLYAVQYGTRKVQGRYKPSMGSNIVPTEKWLIWCELNDEQDQLEAEMRKHGISYVSVRGNTDFDIRVEFEREWRLGDIQVMLSKPSVFGFGLNWQHCKRMAFVGVTDSFEAYYQAVRRCWRFGQRHPVDVHIFASNQEGAIVQNLKRKEADAKAMADAMATETIDAVRSEIIGRKKETNEYAPSRAMNIPSFLEAA